MALKIKRRPHDTVHAESLVRHMLRRDLPEVMVIERTSFTIPWFESEFRAALSEYDTAGVVIEIADEVVGYMVYHRWRPSVDGVPVRKSLYGVRNLAIHRDWRRCGLGAVLLDYLKAIVRKQDWRREIGALVGEYNLTAQRFFAAQGFIASSIARQPFEHGDEDGYLFRWLREWE